MSRLGLVRNRMEDRINWTINEPSRIRVVRKINVPFRRDVQEFLINYADALSLHLRHFFFHRSELNIHELSTLLCRSVFQSYRSHKRFSKCCNEERKSSGSEATTVRQEALLVPGFFYPPPPHERRPLSATSRAAAALCRSARTRVFIHVALYCTYTSPLSIANKRKCISVLKTGCSV